MKGGDLDLQTPATKEVNKSWGFIKMAQSCLTVRGQRMTLDQDPVGLTPGQHPPAPVMEDRLSNRAEDLEHLLPVRGRGLLTGTKILSCMASGGVGGPGRRQLQEVEAVKTAAQGRKRRGRDLNIVQRRKVKNLIGVKMRTLKGNQ